MILITGGCSFSFDDFTWPVHLADHLKFEHYQTGWGSSGNGFISRRVIKKVSELIDQGENTDNILVGIMWSSADRYEIYSSEPYIYNSLAIPRCSETGICQWPEDDTAGQWIIINSGFSNELSKIYYRTLYDPTQSMIYTYEHVLRTQWFLEKYNIKYFMTTFTSDAFNENVNKPQILHLKKLIDWNNFLPISGCYDWVKENSKYDFPDVRDFHPGREQHKEFVEKVIIPYLKFKKYIENIDI